MPSRRLQEAIQTRPGAYDDYDGSDRLSHRRLAYHEAGHAVLDVLLNIHFNWVVATEKEGWVDSSNPCVGWRRGDGPKAALARFWAISSYAGAAAEEVLGEGVAPHYQEWDSAASWLEQFAKPRYARFVGDDSHDRQISRLKSKALRLVNGHFHSITRVAETLLRLHALRRDEVVAIMNGAQPPRT